MIRAAAGVIVGYIVMLVCVAGFGVAAFVALGADRAFAPGAYTPSALWIVMALTCALLAAIAGGWVCAAIAGPGKAPTVLAGVVLVLGLLFLYPVLYPPPDLRPMARMSGEPFLVSMTNARQPAWIAAANPVIGVIGVLLGARRRRRP